MTPPPPQKKGHLIVAPAASARSHVAPAHCWEMRYQGGKKAEVSGIQCRHGGNKRQFDGS